MRNALLEENLPTEGNGWAASAAKGTAATTTKRYTIETLAQTTTLNCVISVEGFYVN